MLPTHQPRKNRLTLTLLSSAIGLGIASSPGATEVAAPLLGAHRVDAADAAAHVPGVVSSGAAARVARLPRQQVLRLGLNLPLRNRPELEALLQRLYDPQSPQYHHYIDVEEFTARFGPSEADYDAVVHWASAHGLQVTATTPNRRIVDVQADARVIEQALHITLNTYQHPREARTFFAADREPAPDLAVPLLRITGLDDFVQPYTHLNVDAGTAAQVLSNATGSGPNNAYLPSDIRAAYYGAGPLTGAGQSIAIFSFVGYNASDVQLYYASTGMRSNVPINNVLLGGYTGACDNGSGHCDDGEQVIDIVNAIGMAPGIAQVLFYEGSSATDAMNRMATDNIAKVMSSSWAGGDFNQVADDPILLEFAAQGQTFVNASGDGGAYNSATWGAPFANAYMLMAGGTHLTTRGPGGGWLSESGWYASGGGFYAPSGSLIPAYQQLPGVITAANGGSTVYRNAPDLAAEADLDNTIVDNGVYSWGSGGTSFAAPRLAGLIALANQQSVANGHATVGWVNPALYAIGSGANAAQAFHDITSGSNPSLAGTGAGFQAVAGFDLVTGWGTPIAPTLIDALAGPAGTALQNGVAVTGLSGAWPAFSAPYVFVVPANASDAHVTISGGSGDADLYVQTGALPSLQHFSCSPMTPGNNETCALLPGDTYYIELNAYVSYAGVSLLGSYVPAGNVLQNNVPATGLSGAWNTLSPAFVFTVPSSASNAQVHVSGGFGEADLYVRADAPPTLGSYSCVAYAGGASERCALAAGHTYYIALAGYTTYSAVQLLGSYNP